MVFNWFCVYTEYPWNIIGIDNKLKIFLFLPNYSHPPPYGSKLIRKYCRIHIFRAITLFAKWTEQLDFQVYCDKLGPTVSCGKFGQIP